MEGSLTANIQYTLEIEEPYTIDVVVIAALYLLALVAHAEPGTHAIVAFVRANLINLDVKMLEPYSKHQQV